jgi:hypothetical protein
MDSEALLLESTPTQDTPPKNSLASKAALYHERIPIIRRLPLSVIGVIVTVLFVNIVVWAGVGIVLVSYI